MMSLWAMSRSPLMLGCEMTDLDEFSLSLITNAEVLLINQKSINNKEMSRYDDCPIWISEGAEGQIYIGLFNLNDEARVVGVSLEDLGLSGKIKAVDLWSGKKLGNHEVLIAFWMEPHGSKLIQITQV
jgi:hypothetical protein